MDFGQELFFRLEEVENAVHEDKIESLVKEGKTLRIGLNPVDSSAFAA